MNLHDQITAQIKDEMQKQGINMTSLGKKMGFGGSKVNQHSRAKSVVENLKVKDLEKLSQALNLAPKEVLFGKNMMIGTGNVAGNQNNVMIHEKRQDKTEMLSKILNIKDPEERKLALEILKNQ